MNPLIGNQCAHLPSLSYSSIQEMDFILNESEPRTTENRPDQRAASYQIISRPEEMILRSRVTSGKAISSAVAAMMRSGMSGTSALKILSIASAISKVTGTTSNEVSGAFKASSNRSRTILGRRPLSIR